MNILSIETSCDESAISIVETSGNFPQVSFRILGNITLSQIEIHREFGGVFPAVAKREHAKALVPLLVQVLKEAGMYHESSRHVIEHPLRSEFAVMLEREPELFSQFIHTVPSLAIPKIDAIAVTTGPGLEPALWVGINFAKALAMVWNLPVIPVDHMKGHIAGALLSPGTVGGTATLAPIEYPAIALLVSGGHTELVLLPAPQQYQLLGETRDDAVGEAFDKVARILGLPYPGGPEISALASQGTPGIFVLPRPMLRSPDYDFSFAGLKTAVLYLTRKIGTVSDTQKADIARDFEDACVEVLTTKTFRAVEEYAIRTIIVGGGVSANSTLRKRFQQIQHEEYPDVACFFPSPEGSTDNALMIAIAAIIGGSTIGIPLSELHADGNLRIA